MGSGGVGGVANDGHFQNVSLCLCVCFSSECGGRRTWGRIEKDEKVENGHTLETKLFMCLLIRGDKKKNSGEERCGMY